MVYRFDGYNYILRLEKDELLFEQLKKFATQQKLASAWLSGLGNAQWVEVGYYDLPNKTYQFTKIEEVVEIANLQGNLAWNGDEPLWHIHGTFSGKSMQASAGHVQELCVGGTCELMLHTLKGDSMSRAFDDEVGLKLLQV